MFNNKSTGTDKLDRNARARRSSEKNPKSEYKLPIFIFQAVAPIKINHQASIFLALLLLTGPILSTARPTSKEKEELEDPMIDSNSLMLSGNSSKHFGQTSQPQQLIPIQRNKKQVQSAATVLPITDRTSQSKPSTSAETTFSGSGKKYKINSRLAQNAIKHFRGLDIEITNRLGYYLLVDPITAMKMPAAINHEIQERRLEKLANDVAETGMTNISGVVAYLPRSICEDLDLDLDPNKRLTQLNMLYVKAQKDPSSLEKQRPEIKAILYFYWLSHVYSHKIVC